MKYLDRILFVSIVLFASVSCRSLDTIAQPVGPSRPVTAVTRAEPGCASPKRGETIHSKLELRWCTDQGSIDAIMEKAGELGYTGVTDANCVPPGLVGHESCACSATPYFCADTQ